MRATIFLSLSLASLALTEAAMLKRDEHSPHDCLTPDVVEGIIHDYTYIMTQPAVNPELFNATVERLLTDDFIVLSESINVLGGIPLGQGIAAYPNRSSLMDWQFRPNAAIPVLKTHDVFFSCSKIAWRWEASGLGNNTYPVKGVITLDAVPAKEDGSTPAQDLNATVVSVEVTSTAADAPSPTDNASNTTDDEGSAATELYVAGTTNNASAMTGDGPVAIDDTAAASVTNNGAAPSAGTPTDLGNQATSTAADDTDMDSSSTSAPTGDAGASISPTLKAKRDDSDAPSVQWRVRTVYSEFNTAAWIKDIGGSCAPPSTGGQ